MRSDGHRIHFGLPAVRRNEGGEHREQDEGVDFRSGHRMLANRAKHWVVRGPTGQLWMLDPTNGPRARKTPTTQSAATSTSVAELQSKMDRLDILLRNGSSSSSVAHHMTAQRSAADDAVMTQRSRNLDPSYIFPEGPGGITSRPPQELFVLQHQSERGEAAQDPKVLIHSPIKVSALKQMSGSMPRFRQTGALAKKLSVSVMLERNGHDLVAARPGKFQGLLRSLRTEPALRDQRSPKRRPF